MKIYPFTKEQKLNDIFLSRKSTIDSKEVASKEFLKLLDKHVAVAITRCTI